MFGGMDVAVLGGMQSMLEQPERKKWKNLSWNLSLLRSTYDPGIPDGHFQR